MLLDGHMHITGGDVGDFAGRLKTAGVDGGIIISLPPASFKQFAPTATPKKRLENMLKWAKSCPSLYPFYWIDPTEHDAVDQVDLAIENHVSGFKIICTHFFCGDERAMPVYEKIARFSKPVLFHSGILWDGKFSSKYNRAANFEALLEIKGLKFSLAHISWPWCDECIAVYGKFLNAAESMPGNPTEMFIDITPGTPPIYRKQALTLLFESYDVGNNVIFGSDGDTTDYDHKWTKQWVERDKEIFNELGLSKKTVQNIFVANLKRFVGETEHEF